MNISVGGDFPSLCPSRRVEAVEMLVVRAEIEVALCAISRGGDARFGGEGPARLAGLSVDGVEGAVLVTEVDGAVVDGG